MTAQDVVKRLIAINRHVDMTGDGRMAINDFIDEIKNQFRDATKLIDERDRLQELAEKNEQAADALWRERDRMWEALNEIDRIAARWDGEHYRVGEIADIARSALEEADDE